MIPFLCSELSALGEGFAGLLCQGSSSSRRLRLLDNKDRGHRACACRERKPRMHLAPSLSQKVDCRGPDSLVVGKNWSPQLAPQREPRAVCLAEEGACILRAETRCPVWKANSTGGAEPEKSLHVTTPAAGSDSSKGGQRPPFTCRVAARPLALGCIGEIASTSRMRPRQRPHRQPHPLSTRVPFRGVFSPRHSAFQECQVPGLPLRHQR